MPDKKYQIFISSTYADLIDERNAVSRAVLDMEHIPAGMEMFPASDHEQMTYIEKVIDECDYYILILGARYGSLDAEGVSYTQREYEYAVSSGKTVLAFVHENMDEIQQGKTDKDDEKRAKLEAFKAKVCTGRIVKFWNSPEDLASKCVLALTKAFSTDPQTGWVRADQVPEHSTMADVIIYREQIDKLSKELTHLRNETKPVFDDAADLNHPLEINYTYQSAHGPRSGSVKIDYKQFLRLVAPKLHSAGTVVSSKKAVETGLRERHNVTGRLVTVKTSEVQDALMHLVANGLVRMWSGNSTEGKPLTGFQLTEAGLREWQQMSYVKEAE